MRRFVAAFLLFAACAAPPPAALPEATGRGLVAFDAEAPAGAVTWNRPEWRVGDTFTMVRGEHMRGTFRVLEVAPDHYAVDTGGGPILRRSRDLGNLGEWNAAGEPQHLLAPADTRYHWPLWVGKKWSCEFVDRGPGAPPVPLRADYVVEDLDTITVPAGTFPALRIVRTLRIVGVDARYLTQAKLTWYAPDLGIEIRQLDGDSLVELVEKKSAASGG
ncbi:MAG: hypothetical protein JNK15_13230 [Planctomycetes bacterium]|nr:hypothetical protein [Planctomycetota bacterium]